MLISTLSGFLLALRIIDKHTSIWLVFLSTCRAIISRLSWPTYYFYINLHSINKFQRACGSVRCNAVRSTNGRKLNFSYRSAIILGASMFFIGFPQTSLRLSSVFPIHRNVCNIILHIYTGIVNSSIVHSVSITWIENMRLVFNFPLSFCDATSGTYAEICKKWEVYMQCDLLCKNGSEKYLLLLVSLQSILSEGVGLMF